jgi:ribosome biogenesis ATPase
MSVYRIIGSRMVERSVSLMSKIKELKAKITDFCGCFSSVDALYPRKTAQPLPNGAACLSTPDLAKTAQDIALTRERSPREMEGGHDGAPAGARLFLSHLEAALATLGLNFSNATPTALLTQRLADSLRQKYPAYQRKKQTILRQQITETLTNARKNGITSATEGAASGEAVPSTTSEDGATAAGDSNEAGSADEEQPAAAAPATSSGSSAGDAALPTASNSLSAAAAPSSSRLPKKRKRPAEFDERGPAGPGGDMAPSGSSASAFFSGPSPAFSLPLALKPRERLCDVGGCDSILEELSRLVLYPLLHPEMFSHLGVEPPRGVLLYGPPGVGKTLLARALGGECSDKGVYFRQVEGSDIVAGISGESEARLRMLFDDAMKNAPAILFIDEIDSIAPRRGDGGGGGRGMDRRILATLAFCLDNLGNAPAGSEGAAAEVDLLASEDRPLGSIPGAFPPSAHSASSALEPAGGAAAASSSKAASGAAGAIVAAARKAGVIVLAATDKPESVDSSLRRAGRFDREIAIPIPDEKGRLQILKMVTQGMRIQRDNNGSSSDSDGAESSDASSYAASLLADLARATPGFVGADLKAVAKEAALSAISRFLGSTTGASDAHAPPSVAAAPLSSAMDVDATSSSLSSASSSSALPSAVLAPAFPQAQLDSRCYISREDLFGALKKVQPAALREGFATIPNVTWKDVGALSNVRSELDMAILQPLRHPELFKAMGLRAPAGVLLYGPPGCGKTLLAKAIASETHANFISVKGPELLDKYVGESERAVRQLFSRARASAPCVVFFDELDALAPRRGGVGTGGGEGGSGVSERVVNQLLTELDGLDAKRDVFVLAATNRPDIIDPAMLRPGRLEKLLYVPLPTPEDRYDILKTHARHTPLKEDVDLKAIALDQRCRGFSGADLASLVREASTIALQAYLASPGSSTTSAAASGAGCPALKATMADFLAAFSKVQPSVSASDERAYASLQGSLRTMRGHMNTTSASGGAGGEGGAKKTASDGSGSSS